MMSPDSAKAQRAVFEALRAACGWTESEANGRIMKSYSNPAAAQPAPSKNVLYYDFSSDNLAGSLPGETETESTPGGTVWNIYQFVPCKLVIVVYGPDSEALATQVKARLYIDGKDKPMELLRKAGIYLIPFPDSPAVVYEEDGKSHRKRADLTISARMVDNSAELDAYMPPPAAPAISTPPAITIHVTH